MAHSNFKKAVERIDEETTVNFLITEVMQYHRVPNYLLSDRGTNFLATYCKSFYKSIGCRQLTTSAWRANCNGMVEQSNQNIVQTISKMVKERIEDVENWDLVLPEALFALRTMKNESTLVLLLVIFCMEEN